MSGDPNVSDGQEFDDGQYDGEIAGYKTIETVETKIGLDGVEETHITHDIKMKNPACFTLTEKMKKVIDKIDWKK